MQQNEETTLLVDISNSYTKCALQRRDALCSPLRSLPTREIHTGSLARLLADWEFDRAMIASVVPQAACSVEKQLTCPVQQLNAACKLNLHIAYETSSTLGADRLAAAIALADEGGLPALSIDAGTAVTFDLVVEQEGRATYLGGAIAPGLRTMAHALSLQAAQLPEVDVLGKTGAIGRNTADCIRSGLAHGFTAMVEGIIHAICAETATPPKRIVLTGGDADFLSRTLTQKNGTGISVDKTLVLKGIGVAAKLNH